MRPAISDSLISGQPLYLLYSYSYRAAGGAVALNFAWLTQATGSVRLQVTGSPPTTREFGLRDWHPNRPRGTPAARASGIPPARAWIACRRVNPSRGIKIPGKNAQQRRIIPGQAGC